jgi:hypothetical protein
MTTRIGTLVIRPRHVVVLAVLMAVTLLAATAVIATTARSEQQVSARPTIASALPATIPPATATPTTPQEHLQAFAQRIRAVPADAHPGQYAYLHTQLWARATDQVTRWDTHQWQHRDGSGQVIERRLPNRDTLTQPPIAMDRAEIAAASPTVENYGRGGLPPAVQEPVSGDTAGLEQQLYTNAPQANGPGSIITGIVALNDRHYLALEQRAAVLRLLATIPTIAYAPDAVDMVGRTGVAVSLDLGPSTRRLIFNPETGELLVHEETFNSGRKGLFEVRLYLERDRRDQIADRPIAANATDTYS